MKFPEKSMAPPTVFKAGNEISSSMVLLAIWLAPPTLVRDGKEMLESFPFSTNAKEPEPVAKLPTEVKLGAMRLVM